MLPALGLLAAAPLTSACEEPSWPTQVACVGDSITEGDGVSTPGETYPAVLQTLLGERTQVGGFGHSGATLMSAGAGNLPYTDQPEYAEATRFVAEAGPASRVAVVVLLGANDSKAIVREPSARRGLPLIDLQSSSAGHPELLVDGVHPNARGYASLAATVRDVLLAHPPKPQRRPAWWRRLLAH